VWIVRISTMFSFDITSLSISDSDHFFVTADAIDQWFENFHHYEVTLVSFNVSDQ
jgi:hypothetical protein